MIEVEGITKTYRVGGSEVKALDHVSLTIQTGDFVALRGPSGSGKSTLMGIIGCLDRGYSGTYKLNGTDVGTQNADEFAVTRNRTIGFVHQGFNLLPRLTALENVELPLLYSKVQKQERIIRAREALDAVGLSKRLDHKPHELSGGQQQRVAIARALINKAPLVLADEPTGNLDSKSSVEIMTILQKINERGTTILLVTHEPDIAGWAQSSIFFRDGRIGA